MSNLRFEIDRAGFLMIWVEQIRAYIHWLPIPKIEFEIFMCDLSNTKFDDKWYEEQILPLNERISVRRAEPNNYWKLFMTGVQPGEAQEFANWLNFDGQYSYSIPTYDEWMNAYKALKGLKSEETLAPYLSKMPERIQTLYKRLNDTVSGSYQKPGDYTLANQMLMRQGVREWVRIPQQKWGGMGKPATQFQASLQDFEISGPDIPRDPEKNRFHYYGFRLLRK